MNNFLENHSSAAHLLEDSRQENIADHSFLFIFSYSSKIKIFLIALAFLLSISFLAVYLYDFSVNVPYYDEWTFVPLVHDWLKGNLSWKELLAQHDGHRIVLQKIIAITSASLDRWDVRIECWTGYGFVVATTCLFYRKYSIFSPREISWMTVLVFITITELLFSLRQWENFLAPWAVNPFASTFFFVLSIIQLEKKSYVSFSLALVAAILASLSFTNGLLVWPIGLLYITVSPLGARKSASISIWLAAALVIALLFVGGESNSFQKSLSIDAFVRGLGLLGIWFSGDKSIIGSVAVTPAIDLPVTIVYGSLLSLLMLLVVSACLRRQEWRRHLFSLSVLSYGLASVGMIAVGHSGLGAAQVLSARYSSTGALAIIGTCLLMFELWGDAGDVVKRRAIAVACIMLVTAVAAANIPATVSELVMGKYRLASLESWRDKVLNYKAASDQDLANPHFPVALIRTWSGMMDEDRIGPFRSQIARERNEH